MKQNQPPNPSSFSRSFSHLIFFLIVLTPSQAFNFKELVVIPTSTTINVKTTYQIAFDRTVDNSLVQTAYASNPVPASATITVTFPPQYTLSNLITCLVQVNGAGNFAVNPCEISGSIITLSSVFATSMIVTSVILTLSNILNPYPAVVTGSFAGSIGVDIAVSANFNSIVTLTAASLVSAGFTFSPNYVYQTESMVFTITSTNAIPTGSSVSLQFPSTGKWSLELSSSRTFPITSVVSCASQSANIQATMQCTGSSATNLITLTNMFTTALPPSTTFSFSLTNFPSPPTNQPIAADAITITTYTSGSAIDTGSAYVSGLVPIVLSGMQITTNILTYPVVNTAFSMRVSVPLINLISQLDSFTLQFPPGMSLTIGSTSIGSTVGINSASASFLNNILTVNMVGSSTLPAQTIVITLNPITAPPSTQPTSQFIFTVLRNGYPKMTASTTFTALSSTVSFTVSRMSTVVGSQTSYTFTLTTLDALTPTGQITIVFPSRVGITTAPNCALLTGTNTASSPICQANLIQNSITLSSLNSSSLNIIPQTMTIKINAITNPSSSTITGNFGISTYYQSSTSTLVGTGTQTGVVSTAATIDASAVSITASSTIASDTAVTYTFTLTVANPIPVGGYVLLYFPLDIQFDLLIASTNCKVNINSNSPISTQCSATPQPTSTMFNFTNPFSTQSPTFLDNVSFIIASAATNPPSTMPVSSFSVYTYANDGSSIAFLNGTATIVAFSASTPSTLLLNTFSRTSNQNGAIAIYTFNIKHIASLSSASVVRVVLPSGVSFTPSSSCNMVSPLVAVMSCVATGSTMRIVLPNIQIEAALQVEFTISSIQNPYSYAPLTGIAISTKTPNDLYFYSLSSSTNSLSNTIPSLFASVSYLFTPPQLNSPLSLRLQFSLSQSALLPTVMRVTLPNYFTATPALTCSSFVDFSGVCTNPLPNTLQVNGTFTSSIMQFTLSSFTSPIAYPTTTQYVIVNTFTSTMMKIDQSSTDILFTLQCPLPCQTCAPSSPNQCSSCYSNPAVTPNIYYDSTTLSCYSLCPNGKYASTVTFQCTACDPNCLTCVTSADNCLTCNTSSTVPLLFITSTSRICVSACNTGMFPNLAQNPFTCTACQAPCATCLNASACLSCVGGTFLISNSCPSSCPPLTTVANSVTNKCDSCNISCLTCALLSSSCTSCSTPLVYYSNTCLSACPSGLNLAPQNGVCTPCSSNCLICVTTINNCISCNTSTLFKYLYNNVCYSVCPPTYYNDTASGQCVYCAILTINCLNCSSATTCLSCNNGFILHNSQCLSYVPIGFVNISGIAVPCTPDCSTCSVSPTNCTSCLTLNLYNNLCDIACPAGLLPIAKVCIPCSSPCKTCDTSTTNCTSCLSNAAVPLYLTNYFCRSTCPANTYANSSNFQCSPCQIPCQTCTQLTVCVSCVANYFLSGSICDQTCPLGFVGVGIVCLGCTNNCKTCVNATNICLNCLANTYYISTTLSCVTNCGVGLYIDAPTQTCIGCSPPCKTCVNTSSTCLSCLTGSLQSNICVDICPSKMFSQLGVCMSCPSSCANCSSLTSCTTCVDTYLIYNNFCVATCPSSAPVITNSVCTPCSTQFCFACTAGDICTSCVVGYLQYKVICLTTCPAGFNSNGTNCVDVVAAALTTSTAFPIPISIAACVLLIACLMSKLQFNNTYMQGAVFSLLSLLEWAALAVFLYLYYNASYSSEPVPLYIALAAMGTLYLLNVFATIVQSIFLCYDKAFITWRDATAFHRVFYVFVSITSFLISHKFRNILFCKLFTFGIFTAKLQDVSKFRIFNVFSLLSLVQSGGAIFAGAVALKYVENSSQVWSSCIDLIALTSCNGLLAFLNTSKDKDFFIDVTTDGLSLHKRMMLNDELLPDKLAEVGEDAQAERGFFSTFNHILNSNMQKLDELSSASLQQLSSFSNFPEKDYEDISVQAYEIINNTIPNTIEHSDKIYTKDSANQKGQLQKQEESSIQNRSAMTGMKSIGQQMSYTTKKSKVDESVQFGKVAYDQQVQNTIEDRKGMVQVDQSAQFGQHYTQSAKHKMRDQSQMYSRAETSSQKYESYSQKSEGIQFGNSFLELSQMNKPVNMKPPNDKTAIPSTGVDVSNQVNQTSEGRNFVEYDQLGEVVPNVIFQEDGEAEEAQPVNTQNQLMGNVAKEEPKSIPMEDIRLYQEELINKIKEKEEELLSIKRKVEEKQRENQKRKTKIEMESKQEINKQIKVNPKEQIKVNPKEQIKVNPKEQIKVNPKEQIKVNPKEQIKVNPKEQIKVNPKEQIKVNSKEQIKSIKVVPTALKNSVPSKSGPASNVSMSSAPASIPLFSKALPPSANALNQPSNILTQSPPVPLPAQPRNIKSPTKSPPNRPDEPIQPAQPRYDYHNSEQQPLEQIYIADDGDIQRPSSTGTRRLKQYEQRELDQEVPLQESSLQEQKIFIRSNQMGDSLATKKRGLIVNVSQIDQEIDRDIGVGDTESLNQVQSREIIHVEFNPSRQSQQIHPYNSDTLERNRIPNVMEVLSRNATHAEHKRNNLPSEERESWGGDRVFLNAAKGQFAEQGLTRKYVKNDPLKIHTRWEQQNEDNSISQEDRSPRRNLVISKDRTVMNKSNERSRNMQNFASHLILPQESDKQETSFKKERQLDVKTERRNYNEPSDRSAAEVEVHFEAKVDEKESSNQHSHKFSSPHKPQLKREVEESDEGAYMPQLLMHQLNDRPPNDDLQEYYHRKKSNSKEKKRGTGLSAQKIYLQRLEKRK